MHGPTCNLHQKHALVSCPSNGRHHSKWNNNTLAWPNGHAIRWWVVISHAAAFNNHAANLMNSLHTIRSFFWPQGKPSTLIASASHHERRGRPTWKLKNGRRTRMTTQGSKSEVSSMSAMDGREPLLRYEACNCRIKLMVKTGQDQLGIPEVVDG